MDVLETFINVKLPTPDTVKNFQKYLQDLSDEELAEILSVAGYIPDFYAPDGAEETLFSKLVEVLVGEWAKRIGFLESFLQTAKSSVEDVTIKDKEHVIVCDAKSFRLSRSQASPNVKDVIKEGDYRKWLGNHKDREKLGGLITFPSMHDNWSNSDIHHLSD